MKPNLTRFRGTWRCRMNGLKYVGTGSTPQEAFDLWHGKYSRLLKSFYRGHTK